MAIEIEKINFDKKFLDYLFPQRTRLLTEYSLTKDSEDKIVQSSVTTLMKKDFDMVKNFLPEKVSNILDVGCGLALIDIGFYYYYDKNISLHLLDKNSEATKESVSGFRKEYFFYNSMESTKQTLLDNDVSEKHINLYEVGVNHDKLYNKKFDLIISLLSCGWHYHVETYLDLFLKSLNDDGIIIIDIRHDTGQLEFMLQHFQLVEKIINNCESKHTGGTVGDRYVFRKITTK